VYFSHYARYFTQMLMSQHEHLSENTSQGSNPIKVKQLLKEILKYHNISGFLLVAV